MKTNPLRWGILGTANIARKNWLAIRNSNLGTLTAVASRSKDRAEAFIQDCQSEAPFPVLPRAFGSYADLLASPEVDAVYIPLPTGLRKEWVLRAAANSKHIVCEKPCALSASDLEEMIEACQRHGVQFMDGVMFMHSLRLGRLRETLDNGTSIGGIRRITSAFSFCAPPEFFSGNIRSKANLEPHGCLGDLGWYCIRFFLWVMHGRLPRRVTGRMLAQLGDGQTAPALPTDLSGELFFDGGVSAGFYCSFITADHQWAHIAGTQGTLRIDDFVLPFFGSEVGFESGNAQFQVKGCSFNMEPHARRVSIPEYSNSHPTAQESNLFRNFASQVQSGRVDDSWPDWALKTQRVADACLLSAQRESALIELA